MSTPIDTTGTNPPGMGTSNSSSSSNNPAGAAPVAPAPACLQQQWLSRTSMRPVAPSHSQITTKQLAHIITVFNNGQATIRQLQLPGQPQPQAHVSAAVFPLVLVTPANPPQNGTSLLNLFPDIEGLVLFKVTQHGLKPRELYKLNPMHKDNASSKHVLDASMGVVTVHDITPRDYLLYHSLYILLSTYFNVLAGFFSTGVDMPHIYQVTSSFTMYLECLAAFN